MTMLPCKKCAYRRNVPGSRHTRCAFKWMAGEKFPNRFVQLGMICTTVPNHAAQWFRFPLNYDPVWGPDECPQFSETAIEEDTQDKYPPAVELMGF